MTFFLPSLIIVNYPVEILRMQNYGLLLTHTVPVTIGMFLINQIVFKTGLKYYEGAGG